MRFSTWSTSRSVCSILVPGGARKCNRIRPTSAEGNKSMPTAGTRVGDNQQKHARDKCEHSMCQHGLQYFGVKILKAGEALIAQTIKRNTHAMENPAAGRRFLRFRTACNVSFTFHQQARHGGDQCAREEVRSQHRSHNSEG